jgi:hypothetical protein
VRGQVSPVILPSNVLRSTLVSASLLLESNLRLSLVRALLGPFRPSHDLLSPSSPKVALRDKERKKDRNSAHESRKKQRFVNGSRVKRTRRSRHFDFLVLTIVGTGICTRVNTPLRCWRYGLALVAALHSECATVALRGNVTCRPRGCCSTPTTTTTSSSPAPAPSSTPFGQWPRWRWGWRG